MNPIIPVTHVENQILFLRGERVMLDADLAELYGVSTKRLNEQVKRNSQRFPREFMFQLSTKETALLMRSQIATGSKRNVRYRPYVFTEHGAIMLASVLNSSIAIQASIAVVKAFVRIRELLATHKDLARKLRELENKYDAQFKVVFDAIRELMNPSKPAIAKIKGFRPE
jgi:hypothetical protein